MKYIFCDTETTGLNSFGGWIGNDPITLSFIIADDALNIKHRETFKSRPYSKDIWSEESEAVHGIGYDDASKFQSQHDACVKILTMFDKFYDGKAFQWVEHSLKFNGKLGFDLLFTYAMFMKQDLQYDFYKYVDIDNSISTVNLGKKAGYTKNNLALWSEKLDFNLNHHDAESDVEMCYVLFKHLTKQGEVNDTKSNARTIRGKTSGVKLAITEMQNRLL